MNRPQARWICAFGGALLTAFALTGLARAEEPQDGARVLVIASDARADNLELMAAYMAARGVPADRGCVLSGLPDATADVASRTMGAHDYERLILDPVQACLAEADDPVSIDFLVLLRGAPHHVTGDGWQASVEALLTVGATTLDDAPLWRRAPAPEVAQRPILLNPRYEAFAPYELVAQLRRGPLPPRPTYAALAEAGPGEVLVVTEAGVERQGPVVWDLRPTYRLDGGDDLTTQALIDRSVQSDGTAPAGVWLCMEGADPARGVRDRECDRALDLLEEMDMDVARPPWTPDLALPADEPVIAYFTGAADLRGAIDGLTYRPGALTDNVTSFGAVPGNWSYDADGESQTSIVRFLTAGASATHGTSAEPLNGAFASAAVLVLYAQGYTLGEAYALSLPYLRWMNVPVGDPLMAPYLPVPDPPPPDPPPPDPPPPDPPPPDPPPPDPPPTDPPQAPGAEAGAAGQGCSMLPTLGATHRSFIKGFLVRRVGKRL